MRPTSDSSRNASRSRAEPTIAVHVQTMRIQRGYSAVKMRVPQSMFASVRQLEATTSSHSSHQQPNVTTVSIRKRQVAAVAPRRRASAMQRVPAELLFAVLSRSTITELLVLRGVDRRFRAIAEDILLARFTEKMSYHTGQLTVLMEKLTELTTDTRPRLQHYRQFLDETSIADVKEVSWYANPPHELKAVCTCLAVLRAGVPADTAAPENMAWGDIKKLFGRQDFKGWYASLRANVEKIPLENLKAVERIIMYDPLVTYERLREVSMVGYRLLIVVAAALQFGLIHTEIRKQRAEIHANEQQVRICEYYVDAITSNYVKNMIIR